MTSYFSIIRQTNKSLWGLAFLWSLLWFSLNAESRNIDGSLVSLIHATRFYLPYIAAFIAIGWMVINRLFTKPALWQIGLIGYAIIVILSSVVNEVPLGYIHFHASIICAVIITLLGNALTKKHEDIDPFDPAITLAVTGIAILAMVLGVFVLRDIVQGVIFETIKGYQIQPTNPHQFGMETPRPTGNARSAIILLIAALAIHQMRIVRSRIIIHIAAICLALLLFYQARGSIMAFLVLCGFAFIAIDKENMPSLSAMVRFTLISLAYWLALLAGMYIAVLITTAGDPSPNSFAVFRDFTPDKIGSGRLEHWQTAITAVTQSPLIGLGSQADRIHVGQNVSSIIFYTIICGGMLGSLFAGLVIYRPVIKISKIVLMPSQRNILWSQRLMPFAASLFLFLSVRGLFENSYALFNIDFLLAVPVIWILNQQTSR